MVGLCGVIGSDDDLPSAFVDAIRWRDREAPFSYADNRVEIHGSFHPLLVNDQPVRANGGDVDVWVWGDIYGYQTSSGHVPRNNGPDGSADFCVELYETLGMGFVSGLNGDFALLVRDRDTGTLSFATDRLATRPIFRAHLPDGGLLFTSNLQSLAHHPEFDVSFDRQYLAEYFHLRRVYGVKTPISGVEEFPPASVVTVDLETLSTATDTYWRPTYEPVDRPFSDVVDELAGTFELVLSEWTFDDLDYGLLLSGGSDSRLVQAAVDQPLTSFHNADWLSREARTAQRAAAVNGDDFRFLERDPEYDARLLETSPAISNFSGWFDQAYFTGFEDEIASEVDVLVSGLYADMLFAGGPIVTHRLDLGSVGTITLPVARGIDGVEEYVRVQTKDAVEPLPYFEADRSLAEVLRANVCRTNAGVESHSVTYPSVRDLVMYGDYYPMGADTDAIFSRSLMQLCPYRTPFLDNRMIDLHRTIPVKYFLRRNLINAAVKRLDPDLAGIPHARTGVPLKYPFVADYLGDNLTGFWWKHVSEEEPPDPYLDHAPWPDRCKLLRAREFAEKTIRRTADLQRSLPFLDHNGALQCYRDHEGGENNMTALYSLLTFLNTPVARAVFEGDGSGARSADAAAIPDVETDRQS
ncbi:asparagine synthase-related protein [Halegenticoccus tardaugens]|uniref:asparagine synthase-related protein n=1 Tax=Halegenticoccus tardaugens TaxID=2071624 RepID=UPI00100BDB51|nr:asparagine synthase-related protein [Halegenticoccus tardaugens]